MDALTLALAKNYTDNQRLAYAETEEKTVLPESVYSYEEENAYVLPFTPVDGGVYIVTVNGKVNKFKAETNTIQGLTVTTLGDVVFSEDGIPLSGNWIIMYDPGIPLCTFGWMDGTTDPVTISIIQQTETIHPIDPKFLPEGIGGGLETVELTTLIPFGSGTHQFSSEDSTKLDSAFAKGSPLILALQVNAGAEMSAQAVCNVFGGNGMYMGVFFVAGFICNLVKSDDVWAVQMAEIATESA